MSTDNKEFSAMSRDELLGFCQELYTREGIAALAYPSLKAIPKLYFNLYGKGLSQKVLLQELGVADEYKQYLLTQPIKYGSELRDRWSWAAIVEKATAVKESEGRLPPALWFQKNGYGSLIQALYYLGHTWDELREAVGDFTDSNFVQSRNGLRWLSHAEASLSNFLYARGIEHKKGERYDESFAELSISRYAIYDLHFQGMSGEWLDVEIWGDKPNGHNAEKYAKVRAAKEAFNADNQNFIGIHHSDCYDEEKLTDILSSFIGHIGPFQFDKPTDRLLHSTHWSNADELLDFCKDLASKMPDGRFPTEEWLRKRGKWESREGQAYNTLSIYIKQWLGGIRNLRRLIGQEDASTQEWDRESALAAYKAFYDKHGITPQQLRHNRRRKADLSVSEEDALEAARISSAVQKHAGGADAANVALGITIERQNVRWTKEALISAVKHITNEYGMSPNQVLYDYRKGRIELPDDELSQIKQLTDALSRYPGGLAAIYEELGMRTPSRGRQRSPKPV